MKFNLQVTGIKEVQRSLNKFNKEAVRELQREIDSTAINIHKQARRNAPVAHGILRARIFFSKGRLAAIVWSQAKYSVDVERGTQPGTWPNRADLQRWVKKKINPPAKRLKAVTYLVGRKIYTRGTNPQPYFEPAVDQYRPRFMYNVRRKLMKLKL